jgi:hypothetical protein
MAPQTVILANHLISRGKDGKAIVTETFTKEEADNALHIEHGAHMQKLYLLFSLMTNKLTFDEAFSDM